MAGPATSIGRFVKDNPAEAGERLRGLLAEDSQNAEGWRLMGQALRALGEDEEAARAELSAIRASAKAASRYSSTSCRTTGLMPA